LQTILEILVLHPKSPKKTSLNVFTELVIIYTNLNVPFHLIAMILNKFAILITMIAIKKTIFVENLYWFLKNFIILARKQSLFSVIYVPTYQDVVLKEVGRHMIKPWHKISLILLLMGGTWEFTVHHINGRKATQAGKNEEGHF
jgi:hypothetical protein